MDAIVTSSLQEQALIIEEWHLTMLMDNGTLIQGALLLGVRVSMGLRMAVSSVRM